MSEMIERVARALALSFYSESYDAEAARQQADGNWRYWANDARAAIEAMREPTESMVRAGYGIGKGPLGPIDYDSLPDAWRDMIDAALK